VNDPVVINNPFSPRPAIAPRKSLTTPGGDGPLVPLALEVDRERHQRQAVGTRAIDAPITALARNGDVHESSLAEDALGQALKAIRRQLQQPGNELILPAALCSFLVLALGARRLVSAPR
jgi:hypothetical protein